MNPCSHPYCSTCAAVRAHALFKQHEQPKPKRTEASRKRARWISSPETHRALDTEDNDNPKGE